MANSLKQLMGMSESALIAMGAQNGLTFHAGMRKAHMAQQLQQSAASGWMEVNQELMSGIEDVTEDYGSAMMFEGHTTLSDAAHMAQIISGAGYTEAFHEAMNGPSHHVEAVGAYLEQLGVSTDQVWMHMPKSNPNIPARHFNALNEYLRDGLSGHQDIMPEIKGHYAGNFMDEFSTNKGGVAQSYDYLSHLYVDREQYTSRESYLKDISSVSSRLQSQMGGRFAEVAFASAIGAPTAYINSLPQLGNPNVVGGIQHPRAPLNASGLPLGSFGAGINAEYSLTASITGQPGWADASKALYSDIAETAKSLAKVYSGSTDTGLNRHAIPLSDEKTAMLDAASRYIDIADARTNYDRLDNPLPNKATLENVVRGWDDYDFAPSEGVAPQTSSYADQAKFHGMKPSYKGDFDHYGMWSMGLPSPQPAAATSSSNVQYHAALQQGTPEWLAFRQAYDITGSTVGDYLGNNQDVNPIKALGEKIGLTQRATTPRQQQLFDRGHRLEAEARPRVASQFGVDISEVGAITNSDYPNMMYSPDGLIGDDALWEHKAPNNFKDLSKTPNYMDQMQLGMHLSGRSRTLFTQTVGSESRSQWIDADPEWYDNNRNKLDSIAARADAGRRFIEENEGLADKEMIAGARRSMTGEGIWGFRTRSNNNDYYTAGRGGMSRYSSNAGTSNDEFIGARSSSPIPDSDFGSSSVSEDKMAESVKRGILGAQEENKQKAGGGLTTADDQYVPGISTPKSADEAFDRMMNPHRYNFGGGGSGGGDGGGGQPPSWFTGGNAGGDIVRGLAGGSIGSVAGGAQAALMRTPWGMAAAAAYGTMTALNEGAEAVNEYVGQAEDAGLNNPNEYSSMGLGLQQLGLSEQQAGRVNATTHSAFNTLLNGDPSGALRIVQGTRGLVTIGDIRQAEGDPVALARIIRERGAERGWSQQRIAGAMEMAGLGGMARAANRTDYAQGKAEGTIQAGRDSDYGEGIAANDTLQANRGDINVSQIALSNAVSHGAPIMNAGRDAIIETRSGLASAGSTARNIYDFIAGEESGGNPTAQSSTSTAYGSMQTLAGTRRDPGFGVTPARDNSPEEAARVGRDYYDAMLQRYGGDNRKAMAAYTDGPGTVDSAIKGHGSDWLSAMPQQAQTRVSKYDEWARKGMDAQEGAGGFTRNGVSYGQAPINVQVNVDAKVNNKQATATAIVNGQTVTQTQNMGNGAYQSR